MPWRSFLLCVSVLYILCRDFPISGWAFDVFFLPLSLFSCPGIARNCVTMFLAHSSGECVLCLSCDLFCDGPASFCNSFLLQFSFSEFSVMFGLSSSKIKSCYNLSKCCSHFAIAMFFYAFVLIGRSIK